MKDTTKDFTKSVGSLRKATSFIRSLIKDESLDWTTSMYKRRIHSAGGTQKSFNWYYNPEYKYVGITYTDGRPKSEEKIHDKNYYIIWVEGLSCERGEKILSLDSEKHSYTCSMTRAMRVLPEDLEQVKGILRSRGVAGWVLDNPNSFIKVHYAPKGTIYKP